MNDLWPLTILLILLVFFAAVGALFLSAIHKHLVTDCRPFPSETLPMQREEDEDELSPRERQIKDQLVSWSRPMELH